MKVLPRILITLTCLFAAISCYVFGIPAGGFAFLFLGLIFEVLFWLGIFGVKRRK